MSGGLVPTGSIAAALNLLKPVDALGTSFFLYANLLRHAGPTGTVVRRQARLAADLAVSESRVEAWIARLVSLGLLRIHSPAPFFTLRIVSWPSSNPDSVRNLSDSAVGRAVFKEGYGSKSKAIALQQAVQDGGPGEGELLGAAREILGDTAEAELEAILRVHPRARVARILARVRATPPEKIRKSKLAFFRHLIAHDHP